MATVFNYRVWDPFKDVWVYPTEKCTAERIKRNRGELIPGTGEEVDPSKLNELGCYQRPSVSSAADQARNIKPQTHE